MFLGLAASLLASGPQPFFQKGVNLTAEGPDGYSPAVAGKMIAELANYGMNAIALVPYGFERPREPMVHYSSGRERAELIEAVAALAHTRGMKVLLKPQLWVHCGYPGEIEFAQESDRARGSNNTVAFWNTTHAWRPKSMATR